MNRASLIAAGDFATVLFYVVVPVFLATFLIVALCTFAFVVFFVCWLVERRRPDGGSDALHGLSFVANVLIVCSLVFLCSFGLTKVPVLGNRTWCQSASPDGTYTLQADRVAWYSLSGVPTRFTLRHVDSSGDVLESRSTIVYVPSVDEVTFQSEPCAVEWGEGHVDIGAQRRFDTRPDYFFSFYWDDQIPTQE